MRLLANVTSLFEELFPRERVEKMMQEEAERLLELQPETKAVSMQALTWACTQRIMRELIKHYPNKLRRGD
jgi:hypothetical protein